MKKFIVYPGNNPTVIKQALTMRGIWEDIGDETEDALQSAQFIWKPTNLTIRGYAIMNELGKDNVFIQVKSHLLTLTFEARGLLNIVRVHKVFNHFEINRGLCTKTGLIRSLKQYYASLDQAILNRYTVWESTPTSFVITAGYETQEYISFIERFRDITKGLFNKERVPEKHCQENMWLVKPANLNQGRGIEVFKNLRDIQTFLNSRPANTYWVAQKYIEKPLLYYGRKFDIRMWVLLTNKYEIFLYRKGYIRTSSDEYDMNNSNNYVHLTNNCLQKHGDNYGKHEPGNTLDLKTLQAYIEEKFPQYPINFQKHILGRIKDLIIDTILSNKKSLNPNKRKNCFELFGYDFLIDEDFRTWLIEVNTNPYLGIANEFIKTILPQMIDDMLELVLDIHFPPNPNYTKNRPNDFELLYCENGSIHHNGSFNIRSPFSESIYPIASMAPPIKNHRHFGSVIIGNSTNASANGNSSNNTNNGNNNTGQASTSLGDNQPSSYDGQGQGHGSGHGPRYGSVHTSLILDKYRNSSVELDMVNVGSPFATIVVQGNGNNNHKHYKASSSSSSTTANPIDNMYKCVANLLESSPHNDYEAFVSPTNRMLSMLMNWELLADKDIKKACKALALISKSRACAILTEPLNVNSMINILNSQNTPMDIQLTTITAILSICKDFRQKKRIICDKIIHALIKIALSSCDTNQIKEYDMQIRELAIKCLCTLSGSWNRKMWIPGETRDNDRVRAFLIHQGGILALLIISKKALEEDIKRLPSRECFLHLELSDWEMQKQVLEKVKDKKYKNRRLSLKQESDIEDIQRVTGTMNNPIFLFNGIYSPKPEIRKSLLNKDFSESGILNEIKINIPENILTRDDYTVDQIEYDIEDMIQKIKDWQAKRDLEEEEKREQEKLQKIRAEEEKKQAYEEKRKKAEEEFLKRIEEKKRQQDELLKKQNEEIKLRLQQEEEKKRTKLLELTKKKEEYRKQQLAEQRKRKLEEEAKKANLEEEERNKRLHMQKIFEEWEKNKLLQKRREKEERERIYNIRQDKDSVIVVVAVENNNKDKDRIEKENENEKSKEKEELRKYRLKSMTMSLKNDGEYGKNNNNTPNIHNNNTTLQDKYDKVGHISTSIETRDSLDQLKEVLIIKNQMNIMSNTLKMDDNDTIKQQQQQQSHQSYIHVASNNNNSTKSPSVKNDLEYNNNQSLLKKKNLQMNLTGNIFKKSNNNILDIQLSQKIEVDINTKRKFNTSQTNRNSQGSNTIKPYLYLPQINRAAQKNFVDIIEREENEEEKSVLQDENFPNEKPTITKINKLGQKFDQQQQLSKPKEDMLIQIYNRKFDTYKKREKLMEKLEKSQQQHQSQQQQQDILDALAGNDFSDELKEKNPGKLYLYQQQQQSSSQVLDFLNNSPYKSINAKQRLKNYFPIQK